MVVSLGAMRSKVVVRPLRLGVTQEFRALSAVHRRDESRPAKVQDAGVADRVELALGDEEMVRGAAAV